MNAKLPLAAFFAISATSTLFGQILEHSIIAKDPDGTQEFGRQGAVEITNGFALIGDGNYGVNRGAVQVLLRDGVDQWREYGLVQDQYGGDGDRFGWSVASDGRFVIVGAPFGDDAGNSIYDCGGALIYDVTRPGNPPVRLQQPSDIEPGDQFGWSVDILDSFNGIPFAVVGTPDTDNTAEATGSVYIYELHGNQWDLAKELHCPQNQTNRFGEDVAISENPNASGGFELLVGSPGANVGIGRAYFYYHTPPHSWDESRRIDGYNSTSNMGFGSTVALHGDFAVIGNPNETVNSRTGCGAVYVFERGAAGWPAQGGQDHLLSGTDPGDMFGVDVDLVPTPAGIKVAVGALSADLHNNDSGAVYVYERTGPAAWTSQTIWQAYGGYQMEFGSGVSLAADGNDTLLLAGGKESDVAQIFNLDRNWNTYTAIPSMVKTIVTDEYEFMSSGLESGHTVDFIAGTLEGNAVYRGVQTLFADPTPIATATADSWGEGKRIATIAFLPNAFAVQAVEFDSNGNGTTASSDYIIHWP